MSRLGTGPQKFGSGQSFLNRAHKIRKGESGQVVLHTQYSLPELPHSDSQMQTVHTILRILRNVLTLTLRNVLTLIFNSENANTSMGSQNDSETQVGGHLSTELIVQHIREAVAGAR